MYSPFPETPRAAGQGLVIQVKEPSLRLGLPGGAVGFGVPGWQAPFHPSPSALPAVLTWAARSSELPQPLPVTLCAPLDPIHIWVPFPVSRSGRRQGHARVDPVIRASHTQGLLLKRLPAVYPHVN